MNTMLYQQRFPVQVLILCAALLCLLPLNTVQAESGSDVLSQILSGLQPLLQSGQPQSGTQSQAASGTCNGRYEVVVTQVDGNMMTKVIPFGEFQSQGRGRSSTGAAVRAKQNAEQCMQSHWQDRGSGMMPAQCRDQQRITGYSIRNLEHALQQEICQELGPLSCNQGNAQAGYSLYATVEGDPGCGVGQSSISRTLLGTNLTTLCPCRDNGWDDRRDDRRGDRGWDRGRDDRRDDRGRGRGRDDDRSGGRFSAPQLVSPAQGTTFYHIPRTTLVSWQPVRRAASYLVEVKYHGGLWTSLTTTGDATFATFDFPGPGQGQWRVTAQSRRGRQGTPSAWQSFSYQR